jgi:thiamine-phosphate pyrophosphorylase
MPAANDPGSQRRRRLAAARLYLICDSQPAGEGLDELLRAAIAGGVDIVQLRDKRLPSQELIRVATGAAALCRERGVLFLVNDDPHAALAAGADGVHVGQDDAPVQEVRELLGDEMLVGLSTHTRAEIDAAARRRAAQRTIDYIGVGPVFPTPTKPGRPAVGVELVRYAAASADLPFFAIGGIDARHAGEVLRAGARRLAVVRAIASAGRPEVAARELRAELEQVAIERTDRAAAAA